MVSIDDLVWSCVIGIFKEPIIRSLKSKMAEIFHLENRHDVIFAKCRGWSDSNKISDNDMSTAVMSSKSQPDVEFQHGGRLGEFNGMSSQSYVSHCRVLPLGEFTVTIPVPHATLQGAVTWRNQCHDRATLEGVRIPSAILKVVFRHIFCFLFLMQFKLWRAAAFVSSPILLFRKWCNVSEDE